MHAKIVEISILESALKTLVSKWNKNENEEYRLQGNKKDILWITSLSRMMFYHIVVFFCRGNCHRRRRKLQCWSKTGKWEFLILKSLKFLAHARLHWLHPLTWPYEFCSSNQILYCNPAPKKLNGLSSKAPCAVLMHVHFSLSTSLSHTHTHGHWHQKMCHRQEQIILWFELLLDSR